MSLAVDFLGSTVDVNALIDLDYVNLPVSSRKDVQSASFSQVLDFSTLEAGDRILMFQTQENYEKMQAKWPHGRFGASWAGMLDASSLIPVIFEISKITKRSDDPNDYTVTYKDAGGHYGMNYKQVWRYVG